ncbi:aldo/keto reductase [Natrialbaceae archaeon AArc-T1-2]|uniref:aldo/keto reductase n=1 Tax=Natrialbaceae archaeon AArc-T1-2 TaxID=3053904 RepID=UPI00255A72FE|nr:aldo/keto reductase [Natrialbaceae archaeon AArc-T1-2]WIV66856.1 aldo/keto reductase [Natrialbaceae archaeon AArc-T1-2]
MEYVTLGNTGMTVSRLGLGTWRFGKRHGDVVETDREQAHELLEASRDRGINFIDTANGYGDPDGTAETWIGEWLTDHDREEFVIASKVYFPFDGWGEPGPNDSGLSRKHIRAQIEGTLERLGTDYLDIYYIHRWDESTPIRETLSVLDDLVHEGKVHYLGASSMAAWQLAKALWTSDVEGLERFEVTQPMVNAVQYDAVGDYLEVCADQELAVCPYSPLAGGFLTGKYERGPDGSVEAPDGTRASLTETFGEHYTTGRAWDVLEAVESVADELDATPAQVSLRWLMYHQAQFTCVPIIGARTKSQFEENVGATDLEFSREQYDRIHEARTTDQRASGRQ